MGLQGIVNLSNMARKCRDQFSIEKKFKYTCISGPIYLRQPRHTCVINLNKLERTQIKKSSI